MVGKMEDEVETVHYTAEEIQDKIDEIYENHPYLKDRVLTSDCYCCEYLDVADEYGLDAGSAWQELDVWKWFVGNGN